MSLPWYICFGFSDQTTKAYFYFAKCTVETKPLGKSTAVSRRPRNHVRLFHWSTVCYPFCRTCYCMETTTVYSKNDQIP